MKMGYVTLFKKLICLALLLTCIFTNELHKGRRTKQRNCEPGESKCSSAAPFTCLEGRSKNGCSGDPSHWPKNGCPNQCKKTKSIKPGPTPAPTPGPRPEDSSIHEESAVNSSLKSCPGNHGEVKVLTYNLFWWNLMRQRNGNNNSAGNLINRSNSQKPIDFMGFQECEDVNRVLRDSQLHDYGSYVAGHHIAIAWRKAIWEPLPSYPNQRAVGEDRKQQYYGKRYVAYGRFKNRQTGQTVFFINAHGPLPVNSGGVDGGQNYAKNILNVIQQNAQNQDMVILTGDFNQTPNSDTGRTLERNILKAYNGNSFGGVDMFFSNCPAVQKTNLGNGGSDHDALTVVFSS